MGANRQAAVNQAPTTTMRVWRTGVCVCGARLLLLLRVTHIRRAQVPREALALLGFFSFGVVAHLLRGGLVSAGGKGVKAEEEGE